MVWRDVSMFKGDTYFKTSMRIICVCALLSSLVMETSEAFKSTSTPKRDENDGYEFRGTYYCTGYSTHCKSKVLKHSEVLRQANQKRFLKFHLGILFV